MYLIWLAFFGGGNFGFGNNAGAAAVNNNQTAELQNAIYASNDQQTLMNQIRNIGNGIADGFSSTAYALNNSIKDSTAALGNAVNNVNMAVTQGNNETQRVMMQGDNATQRAIMGTGSNLNQAFTNGFNTLNQSLVNVGNNLQTSITENRFAEQQNACNLSHSIGDLKYENAINTTAITNNATDNTQKILDRICQMESNAKDQRIADLQSQLQATQLAYSQQAQNATLISAIAPRPIPAYSVGSPYATTSYCGCNG